MSHDRRPYYRVFLAEELELRKKKNSRYSLRAFARFLGIDAAALSRILNGKQELSIPLGIQVVRKLKLSPEQARPLLASIAEEKAARASMLLARSQA
jgi:plasmid maintenance system antidote protein VapI